MDIRDFKEKIRDFDKPNVPIGFIIDLLGNNDYEEWMLVIKAFIVSFPKTYIPKSYLIEKVDYCINHRGKEDEFLDIYRLKILQSLKEIKEKGFTY